jgi:hypothetical protein
MKTFRYSCLLMLLVLGLASVAPAASAPTVNVKVSNSSGKIVYQGKTNADGTFNTPNLPAGNYVVQFNAKSALKGGPFAVKITAGKQEASADSLSAAKFFPAGVAMKLAVDHPVALNGQIGAAGTLKSTTLATKTTGKNKTKMVNGHEYVWIPPAQGDWLPGKWVDPDSAEGRSALADQAANARPRSH